MAVCELSGQMLIYNKEAYDNITESDIVKAHTETCLETFNAVKPKILSLFQ